MKLLEPSVPSGKNAPKQAASDVAGAVYVVAIVGTAVALVAVGRRWLKAQFDKRNINAGQTQQPTASLFTV